MHIVGLTVENFKRIRAVSITPDETGAVIVSGKNAQGKSSLLDSIWAAIGGRAGNKDTSKPVREGADQARVEVNLGDMIVERIWRNNTTSVKVRSADGAEYKGAQTLLDSFLGRFSFDPLAFTRLKATEQREALIAMSDLPVDIDELDARRAKLFDERTEAGRARKALGEAPEVDESLPPEEHSVAEITDQLVAAASHNWALDDVAERRRALEARVEQLEEGLAHARAELAKARDAEQGDFIDEEALRVRLESVQEDNARIRANQAAREHAVRIAEADAIYSSYTEKIAKIDTEKQAALSQATFPIDGLGFDADGVTFNGVPFSQASSAEQIRVSMGMAIAANPKLRVVRVMDGSLLDADGLAIITKLAQDNDFQVWIERVDDGQGVGFVIEDGELAEAAQ